MALCAKPRKIVKLFKNVKEYAEEHNIKCFALDAAGRTLSQSHLWNFGIAYISNSSNWISILKEYCTNEDQKAHFKKFGDVKNIDWFFNYIKSTKVARIETFYVENLQLIHNNENIYSTPIWGVRYWANGKCHWPAMINEFGMDDVGSMKIPEDIIKFDIGLTLEESRRFIKRKSEYQDYIMLLESANNFIDSILTIILPLHANTPNVGACLNSLLENIFDDNKLSPYVRFIKEKSFKAVRLIVTDAGLNEVALKICREIEDKFNGRMKIIDGLPKEKLFDAGLAAAKGHYVMFISGGDAFKPEAFAFLNYVIKTFHADVVHTSNYFVPIDENNLNLQTEEKGWGDNLQLVVNLQHVKEKIIAWANGMLTPSIYNKLIRREFLEEEKISLPSADDISQWIFSLQCLMLAENYVRIAQPLYTKMSKIEPMNNAEDFPAQIKSFTAGAEVLKKLFDEVLFFDEYSNEKKLLKNLFMKSFLDEV